MISKPRFKDSDAKKLLHAVFTRENLDFAVQVAWLVTYLIVMVGFISIAVFYVHLLMHL